MFLNFTMAYSFFADLRICPLKIPLSYMNAPKNKPDYPNVLDEEPAKSYINYIWF